MFYPPVHKARCFIYVPAGHTSPCGSLPPDGVFFEGKKSLRERSKTSADFFDEKAAPARAPKRLADFEEKHASGSTKGVG